MLRTLPSTPMILTILLAVVTGPAFGQHFCDDPPVATVLTGESVTVSGTASEGHPDAYHWFITPPQSQVPSKPTSSNPVYQLTATSPGLWSVALLAEYQHAAPGGGQWTSEACLTIEASSVVADIELSSTQVATDEELDLFGFDSVWAAGVVPTVEWQIDGSPLGSCNGGPPPSSPGDLTCSVPANWLQPGWHTAGLFLSDPSSGTSSLATADFEVIEIIPLSVDFGWTPSEPDPGQLVNFIASVAPFMPEEDFETVTWDLGDGNVIVHDSCPPFYGSCLQWPHTYSAEGWYDVTVTVETADENASQTYPVKIGDPPTPPVASFVASPSTPLLLETTALSFTGTCEGNCGWSWDFGDGAQSTSANPSHSWTTPERFTISLTVTNDGGSDSTSRSVQVSNCWQPSTPTQSGSCYGGPVTLTAAAGSAWLWNDGATTRTISAPFPGSYWVDVNSGTSCWGHTPATVLLLNCGDPGGDTNLDGVTDAADLSALIPELTDGDGDTVIGAGGGDLTAPGGDVTGDSRLRADDLLGTSIQTFNS